MTSTHSSPGNGGPATSSELDQVLDEVRRIKLESEWKDRRLAELEAALDKRGKRAPGGSSSSGKKQELHDFIAHHKRVRLHDPVWRSDTVHSKTKHDSVHTRTPSDGDAGISTGKGPTHLEKNATTTQPQDRERLPQSQTSAPHCRLLISGTNW